MPNLPSAFLRVSRIFFALIVVAVGASSSLADTTVRGLAVWPSDESPRLMGLVKGRLLVDNLVTDNSGFSIEVGVGASTKVFAFPPEHCRQHRNGDYTCITNADGKRKAQRRLLIRNRGGSVSKGRFYLGNTELAGPVAGAVSIALTSGGDTYS